MLTNRRLLRIVFAKFLDLLRENSSLERPGFVAALDLQVRSNHPSPRLEVYGCIDQDFSFPDIEVL